MIVQLTLKTLSRQKTNEVLPLWLSRSVRETYMTTSMDILWTRMTSEWDKMRPGYQSKIKTPELFFIYKSITGKSFKRDSSPQNKKMCLICSVSCPFNYETHRHALYKNIQICTNVINYNKLICEKILFLNSFTYKSNTGVQHKV